MYGHFLTTFIIKLHEIWVFFNRSRAIGLGWYLNWQAILEDAQTEWKRVNVVGSVGTARSNKAVVCNLIGEPQGAIKRINLLYIPFSHLDCGGGTERFE